MPDKSKIVDQKATDDAQAKIQEIKDAFCGKYGEGWLWQDDARRERLHRFYNDNHNNIRTIKHDGSHLKFPGMNPSVTLHGHQPDFVQQVISTGKGLGAHEVGTGKAQPLDAKLLTPAGWVRMGDICVGDQIITGDGSRTVVEAVFPQGKKEIFRVTLSDGATTECCEEHLWLTQTYREKNQAINFERFAKIVRKCAQPKWPHWQFEKRLFRRTWAQRTIPFLWSVLWPFSLPMPFTYLLGVLLGDGSLSRPNPTISTSYADAEIIDHVKDDLPDIWSLGTAQHAARQISKTGIAKGIREGCPSWAIVRADHLGSGRGSPPNSLIAVLQGT